MRKKEKGLGGLKNELYEYIEIIVLSIVAAFLIFTFLCRPATVSGESMLPTLEDGDRLLISRLFYTPSYGDIVVVTKPNEENRPYIKRIIATGGQEVNIDFEKGELRVDGKLLQEPYIKEATHLQETMEFPLLVPEGQVFVMGDNRNHSKDSRDKTLGTFDEEYILGRCILRILPFHRAGTISAGTISAGIIKVEPEEEFSLGSSQGK